MVDWCLIVMCSAAPTPKITKCEFNSSYSRNPMAPTLRLAGAHHDWSWYLACLVVMVLSACLPAWNKLRRRIHVGRFTTFLLCHYDPELPPISPPPQLPPPPPPLHSPKLQSPESDTYIQYGGRDSSGGDGFLLSAEV